MHSLSATRNASVNPYQLPPKLTSFDESNGGSVDFLLSKPSEPKRQRGREMPAVDAGANEDHHPQGGKGGLPPWFDVGMQRQISWRDGELEYASRFESMHWG